MYYLCIKFEKRHKFTKNFYINKLNLQIMKTLKELEMNCTLIAEFKQPAFVTIEGRSANLFDKANIAKLYYDNKNQYYLYTHINIKSIHIFNNINSALEYLNNFIYNVCSI